MYLFNVYCNVVMTKGICGDAAPTYFCNLVFWVVDLKACAELRAGCRDVAHTEQSLGSAIRPIGYEAQERSLTMIQRNFWTLPIIYKNQWMARSASSDIASPLGTMPSHPSIAGRHIQPALVKKT
jgi:hypothetical protein